MSGSDLFQSFTWHDAELLELSVDRRRPGDADEVVLIIDFPGRGSWKLRLEGCYALHATMNFGVIARESILSARWTSGDPEAALLRARWAKTGVELAELSCFELTTNSTASVVRVLARSLSAEPFPSPPSRP